MTEKVEEVKFKKKKKNGVGGERREGRVWLQARISSLDLGSVQESCTHHKSSDGRANLRDSFDLRVI